MNKISDKDFRKKIETITSATSIKGAKYTDIRVDGYYCIGFRLSTGKAFKIDLRNLFQAYSELELVNTQTLKEYVDRVQSPALAILKEASLI